MTNKQAENVHITEWIFTIRSDQVLNYPSTNFYVTVEGEKADNPMYSYQSSRIEKREKADQLRTVQGNLFVLEPPISVPFAVMYGYPQELVRKFECGFPHDWLQLIAEFQAEKTKSGLVSEWDKLVQHVKEEKAKGDGGGGSSARELSTLTAEDTCSSPEIYPECRAQPIILINKLASIQEETRTVTSGPKKGSTPVNGNVAAEEPASKKDKRMISSALSSINAEESSNPPADEQRTTRTYLKKKADRVYRFDPDTASITSTAPITPFSGKKRPPPTTSEESVADSSALNTTRYGRLVKPPLSHHTGQRIVYDVYGNPISYELGDGDARSSINIYRPQIDMTLLADRLKIKTDQQVVAEILKDKKTANAKKNTIKRKADDDNNVETNKKGRGQQVYPENGVDPDDPDYAPSKVRPRGKAQAATKPSRKNPVALLGPKGWNSPDVRMFKKLYLKENPKSNQDWKNFMRHFDGKTIGQCRYFARKYCRNVTESPKKPEKRPENKKNLEKVQTDVIPRETDPQPNTYYDDFFHSGMHRGLIKLPPLPADNLSSATTPKSIAGESRFNNNGDCPNFTPMVNLDESDNANDGRKKQNIERYVNLLQKCKPKKILNPTQNNGNGTDKQQNSVINRKNSARVTAGVKKVDKLFDKADSQAKQLKRLQRIDSDDDEDNVDSHSDEDFASNVL